MYAGRGKTAWKMYCGRNVGKMKGSDGRCGPTNGPQCNDCRGYIINKAGILAQKGGYYNKQHDGSQQYYCGEWEKGLKGSCGPTTGPACHNCEPYHVNKIGHPMKPG